ncbi:MAG: 2Fe-2S iron-sulfur cluster binding domain-containing protein [Gammaproteobacteria bacterium]|nr:2Fe-2S iron-sulfur cluster binding domain-containing protein [Gammaproteobacteria bacterium]
MSQLLTLSRAARLAGVSRGELQKRIRKLAFETFEGKIAVEDLLRAYPDVDIDYDPVLERVARIKANTRPKSRYTDHWMPEPDVLMARLHDFQHVLTRTKSTLNSMEELLAEVTEQLQSMADSDDRELRAEVARLGERLQHSLEKARTTTDRKAELFAKDAMLRLIAVSARLVPSGHEFYVEGRDSLLEAALRAGLHLDYGCSSGNCGTCKVRVLQGRVSKVREHDYVLSAREQEEGYCLACSNTAVSDVLLEAREALTATDLPHQEIRCLMHKTEAVSEGLNLLHVQTPRTKTLRFMAGQRVNMTLEDGQRRELAVASCPCDGRNLQFLVRRRPGDQFVEALLAKGKGQTILIEGPTGDFLLEEEALEPAIFVAVGDGFGAIKSLIEHAIAIDNAIGMHLFRVDKVPPGTLLGNLCRSWDDALDNFVYRRLEPDASPGDVLKAVADACGDLAKSRLYVAAPAGWTEAFVAGALEQGALEQHIRFNGSD